MRFISRSNVPMIYAYLMRDDGVPHTHTHTYTRISVRP